MNSLCSTGQQHPAESAPLSTHGTALWCEDHHTRPSPTKQQKSTSAGALKQAKGHVCRSYISKRRGDGIMMQTRETRAVGHSHPLGTNTGLQGLGKAMTRTRGAQTPPAFTPALLEASVVVFPCGAAHVAEQNHPHPWAQQDGAAGGVRDAATAGRVWLRWEGFGNLPLEKKPASSARSWSRGCAAMPQCPLVLQGAVAKSLFPSPPSISAGGSPNISAPHHTASTVRAASPSICQNPGLLQPSRL